MPFWMNLLGRRIVESIHRSTETNFYFQGGRSIERPPVFIPYGKIVASLLMLVLPLLLGLAIARCKPGMAVKARRVNFILTPNTRHLIFIEVPNNSSPPPKLVFCPLILRG